MTYSKSLYFILFNDNCFRNAWDMSLKQICIFQSYRLIYEKSCTILRIAWTNWFSPDNIEVPKLVFILSPRYWNKWHCTQCCSVESVRHCYIVACIPYVQVLICYLFLRKVLHLRPCLNSKCTCENNTISILHVYQIINIYYQNKYNLSIFKYFACKLY